MYIYIYIYTYIMRAPRTHSRTRARTTTHAYYLPYLYVPLRTQVRVSTCAWRAHTCERLLQRTRLLTNYV